jgi:hypothetical protein
VDVCEALVAMFLPRHMIPQPEAAVATISNMATERAATATRILIIAQTLA